MKTSLGPSSPIAVGLGIAVNAVTFVCAAGSGLTTSKEVAVELYTIILLLVPLACFVGFVLVLTRDRTRPFPLLITLLWFGPLPLWYGTWQVCQLLRLLPDVISYLSARF